MRTLTRESRILLREDHPILLQADPGLITKFKGNQHGIFLDIILDDGRRTRFSVPKQDVNYLLEQLGLESTRQLRESKVSLYNNGIGGVLYGIGHLQ